MELSSESSPTLSASNIRESVDVTVAARVFELWPALEVESIPILWKYFDLMRSAEVGWANDFVIFGDYCFM